MGFTDDLKRQEISVHLASIKALGYEPQDIANNALLCKDIYCPKTNTYFEAKTDYYQPINLAIELGGNILEKDLPIELYGRIHKSDSKRQSYCQNYLAWLYDNSPKNISLGLTNKVEDRHFVSYYFDKSNSHYLFPLRQFQTEILFPLLHNHQIEIAIVPSNGGAWYSIVGLVPIAALATVCL